MCCNDLWNHVIKCVFTIIYYMVIIYVVVKSMWLWLCILFCYQIGLQTYVLYGNLYVNMFFNLQTTSDHFYFGFYNFLITTSGSHNCPFPTHRLTNEYSHGWNVMYHLAWHTMNLEPQLFESWSKVPIIWHFYDKC